MKATIWHNPRCSKSRDALAILHEASVDVTVIEYLKHPPARDLLERLFAIAGVRPRDGLRKEARNVADDQAALDLMVRDPVTVERPLVQTPKGARLARPPELVREIL